MLRPNFTNKPQRDRRKVLELLAEIRSRHVSTSVEEIDRAFQQLSICFPGY